MEKVIKNNMSIGYECPECGRGYDQPGMAIYCHATTGVVSFEILDAVADADLTAEQHTQWGDRVVTHATGAQRANADKIRWELMPVAPMRDIAQIWTFGAKKYSDRNWEKGFKWSVPYACMQRHLQAWFAGEDFDAESGMSHLAHAACNLMMLQQFEYTHRECDDRPIGSCPPMRTAAISETETPLKKGPPKW
jgi:hypothetical protein